VPLVFVDDTFALKGGTAINLFVRDMPRLSVDLDLVFPDYTLPREQALARINEAIRQAAARLSKQLWAGFGINRTRYASTPHPEIDWLERASTAGSVTDSAAAVNGLASCARGRRKSPQSGFIRVTTRSSWSQTRSKP